MKQFKRSN